MPQLLDFIRRANSGPLLTENDFNMKSLIPNIRTIINEYEIVFDQEKVIPEDDILADRLYKAALELLVRTGIYCLDTNRVIEFDEGEIVDSVNQFEPGRATFGEGRDRGSIYPRRLEDGNIPWLHVGAGIVASSEEIAAAQVEGYGSIAQARSVSIPALSHICGIPVTGGSPTEIHASVNTVQIARKALQRCGRPGLPIMNLLSSSTTATGTIAASHPDFGLRPSDGWLVDVLAEMKVNYETLNRLAFVQLTNGNIGSTAVPILGGYAGGAPGTALVKTAYYLLGLHFFNGTYQLSLPIHFNHGCNSIREALWVFAITGRAVSRNTQFPGIATGFTSAGPGTAMYFKEAAATILSQVPSGYAGIQTPHPAKAILDDGITPLEARFAVDFTHAISNLSSQEAAEMVNRLLAQYGDQIKQAPVGKKYSECYDLRTRQPQDWYLRLFNEIKEEFALMGIQWD